MSWLSAQFFSWVQGAPFYEDVHDAAVRLLPPGGGKTWLDVGCGPGLVARLASRHGYRVTGIDCDEEMIAAARRLTGGDDCRFEVTRLEGASERYTGDVVSAASLLIVLPDARRGVEWLWSCVRPGGTLLIVETTKAMTPETSKVAEKAIRRGRRAALRIWASARNGRAVDPEIFETVAAGSRERHPLLSGLVEAWILRKDPS
jgi:2-polyprenyl-3-methyl-5-hydroxy-6-metoxy-1,4-benzoquinol methylase